MAEAQVDEREREAQMIEHLLVCTVEAGPVQEQATVELGVVRPLLVLQEFLAHEQHWNARGCQTDAGRDAGAAAPVPGAWIAGIAEPGDAQLSPVVNDVVVLGTLHEAPVLGETVRPKAPRKARHVERAPIRRARRADDISNGDAQTVRERRIETSDLRGWCFLVRIHRPYHVVLQISRSNVVYRV